MVEIAFFSRLCTYTCRCWADQSDEVRQEPEVCDGTTGSRCCQGVGGGRGCSPGLVVFYVLHCSWKLRGVVEASSSLSWLAKLVQQLQRGCGSFFVAILAGQIDLAAAEGLQPHIRFFSGFGAAWRHWGLVPEDDMLSTRIIHISRNILLS